MVARRPVRPRERLVSHGGYGWIRTGSRPDLMGGIGRRSVHRPAMKALQWLAGVVIVVFIVRYLSRHWEEVSSAPIVWQFRPGWVALGVVIVLAVFVLLAEAWRLMLRGWGHPLSFWTAGRIWLLSSMAKYIPGKVWALAGMAVMAREQGVPALVATGSSIILQVLSVGTGALVVAAGGAGLLRETGGITQGMVLAAAVVSLALVGLMHWPPLLRRLLSLVDLSVGSVPPPSILAAGAAATLVAWIGYGLAFWCFALGTMPAAGLDPVEAITAGTAGYVVGAIAPFAPGGLGVREGITVMALQGRTGLGAALALAAVARLGMTVAEVLVSIPFLLTRKPKVL